MWHGVLKTSFVVGDALHSAAAISHSCTVPINCSVKFNTKKKNIFLNGSIHSHYKALFSGWCIEVLVLYKVEKPGKVGSPSQAHTENH